MKVIGQGGRVVTLEGGTRLRLEPGAHASPYDGVCVVELASVLAGEPFSDHPRCVCEVIAGFLRSWNDRAGHFDRQRLVPYASRVVGSRATPAITRMRRDICLSWAGARLHRGRIRRFASRVAMRVRIAIVLGIRPALHLNQGAGEYAARIAFARESPDVGFALLEELLAVGAAPAANGNGSGSANGHPPLRPEGLIVAKNLNGNGHNGNGNGSAAGDGGRPAAREPTNA
jgi:hypothetical protein